MRDLIDTLKLPAVILSVVVIVLCAGEKSHSADGHLPPLDAQARYRMRQAHEQDDYAYPRPVRDDSLAAVGLDV